MRNGIGISVVAPVFNEVKNLPLLHKKLISSLDNIGRSYEILYVDDGSFDNSFTLLAEMAKVDERVKIIQFRRNFGQTAAIVAGIDYAKGDILVFMDADLQNDPADISRLLQKMDEGYDVVSGWRKDRKDPLLTRKVPSYLANKLISWLTRIHLNDYGCTLKAYRREVLTNIRLYGEMHRFIPAYASWTGARITEIVVSHHPRIHGTSKYGILRTLKVLLDLLTVKFLGGYSTKPLYVFGTTGVVLLLLGVLISLFVVVRKLLLGGEWISPMILIGIVLAIASVQFVLMGLLAEMVSRTYFESQGKPIYLVKRTLNIQGE